MFVYVFASQEGIDPQNTQFPFASCEMEKFQSKVVLSFILKSGQLDVIYQFENVVLLLHVGTVGSSVNKNGNLHSPKLSKFVSLVGHKKNL